jgi:hypothetical protein
MYALVYLGWNAILVKNQSSTILLTHNAWKDINWVAFKITQGMKKIGYEG